MSELIGIREAARRIGVSDTAIHKAIKAGRVEVAGRTETSNRPLLAWPEARDAWLANTNESKRSHVGGTGQSERRKIYTAGERSDLLRTGAQARAQDSKGITVENVEEASAEVEAPRVDGERVIPGAEKKKGKVPSITESREITEAYKARMAKIEHDEKVGKLVPADDVRLRWHKLVTAAKTRIMGIPAACKTRSSDLPLAVVAVIEGVCREALEDLANERD